MSADGVQMRLGLREALSDGWALSQDETLADLVGSRTSGLGVLYVLVYIALWGRVADSLDRPPNSTNEIITVTGLPMRTVYRYRDRFRQAFPELDDPAPLYDLLRSTIKNEGDLEVAAIKLGGARLASD